MAMKNSLADRQTAKKITSAEDMNSFIKVLNVRVWVFLALIIIAAAVITYFVAAGGFPIAELLIGYVQ